MKPINFEDPLYKSVHEKLTFIGDGPAAFFRDICRLMEESEHDLESETHLIAFLFREIESAIRDAVRTKAEAPNSGENNHKQDVLGILSKLEIPKNHPVRKIWLRYTNPKYDYQFNKLAHRTALSTPQKRKKDIESTWEEFIYVLDIIIDKVQSNFYNSIELIDKILAQTPSEKGAKILAGHVPQNETTLVYLFQHCNDSQWLTFFEEQGFFKNPPDKVYDNENNYIQYPRWPAGIYLQKAAKEKADEVSSIIKEIPITNNHHVHEKLVQTVANMPADISIRHVDLVVGFIQSGSISHTAESYINLAIHLAKNGYTDETIQILRTLFGPVRSDNKSTHLPYSSSDLAVTNYAYENFLTEQINEIRSYLGQKTINVLTQILSDFLQDQYTPPKDASYSWARSLSLDPDQSYDSVHHVKNNILRALIFEMNYFIGEGENYKGLIRKLDNYNWHIFDRIKLLLHKRHDNLEEIKLILLDQQLFDEYWISREYKSALKKFYPDLTRNEKQEILAWIEKGLSPEIAKKRHFEEEPSEKEVRDLQKRWKLRKLHPIADYLENEKKDKYKSLVDKFGKPRDDEEIFKIEHHTGPTSPKDFEELNQHSPAEVIRFLKEWEPEESYGNPSPRGLSRILRKVVEGNPLPYSQQATNFKPLNPSYIYSLIVGLRKAVKNDLEISWQPVLSLCDFALTQKDDEKLQDKNLSDPIWLRIHKRIADLLGEGCRQSSNSIPFHFRQQVWELIQPLTKHAQPNKEYEQQNNRDPMGVSINTVRGEAMHAVFYYIYWVRNNLTKDSKNITFDHLPEVRSVLEHHLDQQQEPTLTIRSVYGQHLWQLIKTDPEWLNRHLNTIFPKNKKQQKFFYAAWYGFILRHQAHQQFLKYIQPVYRKATTELNKEFDLWDNGLMPDRRLAEHLFGYYWHGDLTLESELINCFFKNAPPELRGYIFEYIGRSIDNMKEELSDEIHARLNNYIDFRIQEAKNNPNFKLFQKELASFGYCFTTNAFIKSNNIKRLREVLEVTPQIEHSRKVMEQLPDYVEEYPELVMECIEIMVKNTDRTIDLQVWRKSLKKILRELLKKDESISKLARELVQYISHQRYHLIKEFKPLLENTQ